MLDLKVNVFSHFSPKQTQHAPNILLELKSASVNTSFPKFMEKIPHWEVAIILFESGHFADFSYKVSSFFVYG